MSSGRFFGKVPFLTSIKTNSIWIWLENVSKSFGALQVLDGITLEIARGETTVIIGPSGTGKSVLLKHIVGLLKPDRGAVWVESMRVDQLSESQLVDVRMKIGFLFQMGALFDSMTVEQNLCFPLAEHMRIPAAQRVAPKCAFGRNWATSA